MQYEIPDLLCDLDPLKSYQALYHDEENHGSACIQLCLSRETKSKRKRNINIEAVCNKYCFLDRKSILTS